MERNDHSGYPVKWFKDQNTARQFYECAICLEVVKDAVQVRDCGHQFCALCIDDILKADPRCPTCRIEISDAMVFKDHAVRRLIKQLEVNCCNEGCTWTGCLSSLLQGHQNNCNFLIQRDENKAQKLKVEELEKKHDTLMLDVCLFKEKHEQDITALKLKHEQDIKELNFKHEEDIKELKLKHQKDIDELQLKHEKEKKDIRDLQLKHKQEFKQDNKDLKFKHEQDCNQLKLKLQQMEQLWQQLKVEEKELCKGEIPQKSSPEQTEYRLHPSNQQKSQTLPRVYAAVDVNNRQGNTLYASLDSDAMRPKSESEGGPERTPQTEDASLDFAKTCPEQTEYRLQPSNQQLKKSKNPWQRSKEKQKEKDGKLYCNVVAILNKLTPQNFRTLVEQTMALNIDTRERLEGVTERIHEQAIRQPMYSCAYANMCRCLFTIKVKDVEGKGVSFRKLLLNRCQKEFKKEKEDGQTLLERIQLFTEIQRKEMKENMDKARMLGNIKFIGELFKLKLLTENVMHDCIFKLLHDGDEESLESVCKLLFTIGKDLDSDKAKPRIEQYFDEINEIIVSRKVSLKVIFMLRDVVELRDNKWIPRREENFNPKTIDQIHREAEMEEKKEEKRLAAQLPSKYKKEKKGAFSGVEYKPKKAASGESRGASDFNSLFGLQKSQLRKPLSEEQLINRTTTIIDNYGCLGDLTKAVVSFIQLHSPGLHHLFILTAVEHTYEMSSRARRDTGRLFAELLLQWILSKEQFTAGFSRVLEHAYDNSIDYPMLWRYLADIITPVILADQFTLSDLKPLILKHLISIGKAAALLAEILLIIKELKGEDKAVEIWKNLGLSWFEVLPESASKEDFLSRKNLNFLPIGINDELLKLLRADQFEIETVFAYIEKNFKQEERKEAQFINWLVTVVAQSCIINREKAGPDCCKDRLKARKDILRKYLDNDITLELEALFALQEIYVKYNKPAAMLSQFFNTLYGEEVLTEAAFMKWKQDENPSRQEAKGPALQATASFFDWVQFAPLEKKMSAKERSEVQGKQHSMRGRGNPQQNQRYGHISNEPLQRNQQGFQIPTVMMPGQRQSSYLSYHPMAMAQRTVRSRVYSSSQGPSPMQGIYSTTKYSV